MLIPEMKNKYIQLVGERNKTEKNYTTTKEELAKLKIKYDKALIAQSLIQKAAKNTQEKLKFSIEKIVTTAIENVFDEENYFDFKLEFETKNDRTHCTPVFLDKQGCDFSGEDDLGGSVLDVASFAARIAMWTLAGDNRTDPIFLLDESFKHLSEAFREESSALLKAFCDDLGLQIIVSTHLPSLKENADNGIFVEKRNGISYAEVM